jgi:hypothetical protein
MCSPALDSRRKKNKSTSVFIEIANKQNTLTLLADYPRLCQVLITDPSTTVKITQKNRQPESIETCILNFFTKSVPKPVSKTYVIQPDSDLAYECLLLSNILTKEEEQNYPNQSVNSITQCKWSSGSK